MTADLNLLHPDLKPLCEAFMDTLADAIAPSTAKVIFTYREPEVQDALYAQGRTTPGKIVTYLTSEHSKHCYTIDGVPSSKAFDIALFDPGGVYVSYGDDQRYKHAGALWKIMGTTHPSLKLFWGGDFNGFVDASHFQIA